MTNRAAARAAKELLRAELAPLGGVGGGIGGIGIGRRQGSYVLTVNVTVDELVTRVPHSVDGVPVEVRLSGPVRPLHDGRRPGRVTSVPAESATPPALPAVPPAPALPAPPLPTTTRTGRAGPASGR